MGDETSERLHSSDEAGELHPSGTRWSEGGRRLTEPVKGNEARHSGSAPLLTGLDWVAAVSKRRPELVWTTLAHHITVNVLREAYRQTRKDGAVGVDGQTWQQYGRNLEGNLVDLRERFQSGRYVAPPVKRVYIPKGKGKKRPIGIPTLEDKVLQRAVAMVLERVYEPLFRDCSYAYRRGRNQHKALRALWKPVMDMCGGVVIDMDIKGFFDNLDHSHLRSILDTRVRDGVIRRAIDKWLKAGVLEGKVIYHPTKGTPQGGVISPLLSNIYLNHVLDAWFEDVVRPKLRGQAVLVRFADDVIIVLERRDDAQRVRRVLDKRLSKYGLTLSVEKTRVIPFRRPNRLRRGEDEPGSFVFLGFTHVWVKSRWGRWVIRQRTSKEALKRAIAKMRRWLWRNRHEKVRVQHESICRRVRGHDNYFGITGNGRALSRFRHVVRGLWRQALNRRSQKKTLTWKRFDKLRKVYPLPPTRVKARH